MSGRRTRDVRWRVFRCLVGVALFAGAMLPVGSDVSGTKSHDAVASRCASADIDLAQQEVVIWHPFSAGPREAFDIQVEAFNQARSDITVTAVRQPNYDILIDELRTTPEDAWPDIIVGTEVSTLNLLQSGRTIAPGECAGSDDSLSDLLPIVEATYSVGGQLVAAPYNVSTPVLIFNAATVADAGLDPESPPSTLDDLRSASDQIRDSGVAAYGLVVYDQYGAWFIRQLAAQRGELLAEPDNGRSGTGVDKLMISSPQIVRDLQWLRAGIAEESFLWIGGNASGMDDLVRMATGREEAAYSIHTSAAIGDLILILEDGAFPGSRLGVGPLPGYGGGLAGGGALWVVDHDDPVGARAAWTVIAHLMEPPHLAALAARTGYVPPRASVLDEPTLIRAWAEHPQLRVGYDQLAGMGSDPASAGLLVVPSRQLDLIVNGEMGYWMLTPGVDIRAALADIETRLLEFATTP